MIIKIKIPDCRLDISDPIKFAQNKKELCHIMANKNLAKRCFADGWIERVVDVSDISSIFPLLNHSDCLSTVTFTANVEIDYVKPSSIILVTVDKMDNNTLHLSNDRCNVLVYTSYQQDGLPKERNQINMGLIKVGETVPIVVKSRLMQYAQQKAFVEGNLFIPIAVSIRFVVSGTVDVDALWHLIEAAEKNLAAINQIKSDEATFIKQLLYPYSKDMSNNLDKMSLVSIVNLAKGVDKTDNCRFVKHSYINWSTDPYLLKERYNSETKKYEDSNPPKLMKTIETTSQKFVLNLLTDFIYNSELFINMCNRYSAENIKNQNNLWRLMNIGKDL